MRIPNHAFWAGVGAVLLAICLMPFMLPRDVYVAGDLPSPHVMVELAEGHGSAVYIGAGLFITAAHVGIPGSDLKLINDHLGTAEAELLWRNEAYDIALLRGPKDFVDAAALSCAPPSVGSVVEMHGNPGALRFVTAWGRVATNVHIEDRWRSAYIVDGTIVPGMSGGAVLNDAGEVVGISVGVQIAMYGLTGFGIVVPGSTICELLGRSE